MTPTEALALCQQLRTYEADRARRQPADASRARRFAASHGGTSTFDDPTITLRCSQLEALARQALGQPDPAPAPDHDQLALDLPPGRT